MDRSGSADFADHAERDHELMGSVEVSLPLARNVEVLKSSLGLRPIHLLDVVAVVEDQRRVRGDELVVFKSEIDLMRRPSAAVSP